MKSNAVNTSHLRAFIERIEKLEEEKRAIADDIKDVYAEAKGTGFDAKVMRKIVSIRRQDKSKRQEEEEILTSILPLWVWSRAQLFGSSFSRIFALAIVV